MNETILLADNDADFLSAKKELLEQEGYNVICASSPAGAQKIFETVRIDLAILDLRLRNDSDDKDESGLDVAREANPIIPKIILTNFPTLQNIRDSLLISNEGFPPAVEFIAKTESFDNLLKAIRRSLRVTINWFDRTQASITSQLNKNYEDSRKRVTIHFWLGLTISIVFAVPVVIGVMMAVTGNRGTGIAGAAGSIVVEVCNYLFFARIDKTNLTAAAHHQELLQSKRLENLIAAVDKLSDQEKRDLMIMRIIETAAAGWLVSDKNASIDGKRKTAKLKPAP